VPHTLVGNAWGLVFAVAPSRDMPDEPLAKRLKVEVDQLKADVAKQEASDAILAAEVASFKAEVHTFFMTTKTNPDAGIVSLYTLLAWHSLCTALCCAGQNAAMHAVES